MAAPLLFIIPLSLYYFFTGSQLAMRLLIMAKISTNASAADGEVSPIPKKNL